MRLCPPLVARAYRLASIADQARHSLFTCQRAESRRAAYARILAARFASELLEISPSKKREGAGKAGCWPHPWSACKQKAGGVTTGTSRTTGPSLRDGFNGVLRALPGDHCLVATVARET